MKVINRNNGRTATATMVKGIWIRHSAKISMPFSCKVEGSTVMILNGPTLDFKENEGDWIIQEDGKFHVCNGQEFINDYLTEDEYDGSLF